jgi:hypothetical protein
LSELLSSNLTVKCANESDIPFSGWVELNVSVKNCSLRVPFLVCQIELDNPILGYNVRDSVQALLRDRDPKVAKAVADVIKKEKAVGQSLGVVKVGKCGITIGPNSIQQI